MTIPLQLRIIPIGLNDQNRENNRGTFQLPATK